MNTLFMINLIHALIFFKHESSFKILTIKENLKEVNIRTPVHCKPSIFTIFIISFIFDKLIFKLIIKRET